MRESPKARERAHTVSAGLSHHGEPAAQKTPEYRGSPPFHTPLASPGERSAGYTQYVPDAYVASQAASQPQPAPRKPAPPAPEPGAMLSTSPTAAKLAAQAAAAAAAQCVESGARARRRR